MAGGACGECCLAGKGRGRSDGGGCGAADVRGSIWGAFSVRAKAKKLVTTGRIRGFAIRSMCLAPCSWFARRSSEHWLLLLPIALLIPMQIARARKEERAPAAAFGEEYQRYKAAIGSRRDRLVANGSVCREAFPQGLKPHSFGLLTHGPKPVPFKTDTN